MVPANRANPENLAPGGRQASANGSAATLGPTANAGVVFVGRSDAGGRLDNQGEKAGEFSRGPRQREQFAGFIKVVRDVRYVSPFFRGRGTRFRWHVACVASMRLTNANQREVDLRERPIRMMGMAHVAHREQANRAADR